MNCFNSSPLPSNFAKASPDFCSPTKAKLVIPGSQTVRHLKLNNTAGEVEEEQVGGQRLNSNTLGFYKTSREIQSDNKSTLPTNLTQRNSGHESSCRSSPHEILRKGTDHMDLDSECHYASHDNFEVRDRNQQRLIRKAWQL